MPNERPTFGSLFAGIGGIDLGLERAGWECRFQVEWDPFCQRVLAKHWPDVPRYGDITAVDWSGVERVDLLAGGFPCQPFSNAGRRLGKADDRWLWPEFARAIGAIRPHFVLVENVPGLLAGHGGMGAVLGDLAELGYDAEWDCIPASAVGAPHLRYRVWIVAHAQREPVRRGDGLGGQEGAGEGQRPERERLWIDAGAGGSESLADPDDQGLQGHGRLDRQRDSAGEWSTWPSRWPEFPGWLPEPDVGRVAHGVPARVDRLRSLGNAVVPQVVEMIGTQLIASLRAVA